MRLPVTHPIIVAPMGGGPSNPRFVAASSNAGALGSIPGAYLTPEQLTAEIKAARALTTKPLLVNLFAGGYHTEVDRDPAPMLGVIARIHDEYGLPKPELPHVPPDPFERQVEAMLREDVQVFSVTFGVPSRAIIDEVRRRGLLVLGTATTAEEAEALADAGVDGIVAQGAEAGAHRGTFLRPVEESLVPTLDLVRSIKRLPVIASGGIMDGREISVALAAGAIAVQLGTAFLLCDESGASQTYKDAVLRGGDTIITRAYSGRAARGIANGFANEIATREEIILPFPIQNTLTRAMRAAAAQHGDPERLSLWAGTGLARVRPMPVAQLIDVLISEMSA